MKKRLFSILLAQCMVLNFVPITAFAEDSTEETPECTCETTCTEETMNAECPVCGAKGALPEKCGKYVEPAAEDETSQPKGEKTQEKQNSDMPDTQSEAALAQMSSEGENGIAVQSAGVAIDNNNFPDANFRTIVEGFDNNKDGSLSDTEIAAVKKINCFRKRITNLKGIEYFTSLNNLWCAENKLTALDVSKNTALTDLYCSSNQLTTLDVSKNTALTDLDCGRNQLTTLDVSKNTALTYLSCGYNQLTTLDVSKNTALTYLSCRNNQLTTLDVSKNTALTKLSCDNNQLTSLDVSNTDMDDLNCYDNIYQIVVGNDRTFDLSTLPGNFDVTKTSDWSGGKVSGNTLTVDNDKDTVTYKYDCGKGKSVTFTLKWQYKDADYTKVNEAIAKANKLNKDDYKNFSAVDTAINAVDRNKNITEQSEVDAMAKAIEDAIAALQYKDANYDKVNEAIVNANKLNKGDYKDFSGVDNAVNAVDRNKNFTEQSEVDAMAKAIEDAIAALQYKDANYDEVDAAITKADALNKDDYKDFSTVDTAINAVVRGKNITEQSEVDKMAKAIEDAIATLQYKDANYDKVNEAIAKANKLNKGDYKDFSGVDNAVNAVASGKNITEQSDVDAMAKAIEDAIADLQYKDADYTKVDAAIKKANALKKDDYKDFSGVKNAVKAVVRGKNITEQSEVDKMAKAIENAISALEKKPASAKPGTSDKNPKTGYTSNLALWIALLFISGGAAVGTMVVSRKKKYNK